MLIHRLKLSGFLSFGPEGIDLTMEPLNVLIGPNGSGKSNFLEAIGLLKSAPRDMSEPFRRDGIGEWLWKGHGAPGAIRLEATVDDPRTGDLQHSLELADRGGRPIVTDERVEPSKKHLDEREALSYYRPPRDERVTSMIELSKREAEEKSRDLRPGSWSPPLLTAHYRAGAVEFANDFQPEESLLSCAANTDYPALWYLQEQYKGIRLYRECLFGPSTALRQSQSAHDRTDFLAEGGANLALVLSHFRGGSRRKLVETLQELFDGVVDITCPVTSGSVSLFLEESGGRQIPRAACPTVRCATSACWPFCCIPPLRLSSPLRSRSWVFIPMWLRRLRSCSWTLPSAPSSWSRPTRECWSMRCRTIRRVSSSARRKVGSRDLPGWTAPG